MLFFYNLHHSKWYCRKFLYCGTFPEKCTYRWHNKPDTALRSLDALLGIPVQLLSHHLNMWQQLSTICGPLKQQKTAADATTAS